MPPKLSARARVFSTGQGRKTDAHSVALVATRMVGLRPVVDDQQLAVLRILVDRRRSLGEDQERRELAAATGTSLLDLKGIGPSGAARLLVEVGDITRFPDKNHFASWNGTAPIDASSGEQVRQRLSRVGNRQINRVLHITATVQLRNPTEGPAYFERKKADGKTSMEAMRCLKRRLSNLVYPQMVTDAITHATTSPGGQRGNDCDSSATGLHPNAGSSDKPLPGPAKDQPTTPLRTAS